MTPRLSSAARRARPRCSRRRRARRPERAARRRARAHRGAVARLKGAVDECRLAILLWARTSSASCVRGLETVQRTISRLRIQVMTNRPLAIRRRASYHGACDHEGSHASTARRCVARCLARGGVPRGLLRRSCFGQRLCCHCCTTSTIVPITLMARVESGRSSNMGATSARTSTTATTAIPTNRITGALATNTITATRVEHQPMMSRARTTATRTMAMMTGPSIPSTAAMPSSTSARPWQTPSSACRRSSRSFYQPSF